MSLKGPFFRAYKKGYRAAEKGKPRVAPYKDRKTHSGTITFSRAFIHAWENGYDNAIIEAIEGKEALGAKARRDQKFP